MILMYTSFGCTSAIKAKAWLKENHIKYVEKNIQSTLLNKEEIRYLLKRSPNGTKDIISTRSKAFKALGKDIDELKFNELVNFIQENPTVLKRPIIMDTRRFVVGFDNDEITTFVPREARDIYNYSQHPHDTTGNTF